MAGHVEDTVPYPETRQKENLIGTTTDQKQREREGDVELDEYFLKKKVYCWSRTVGRKDFAVCTLPFQPSSVTSFCLKHEWKDHAKIASCLRICSFLN